MAIQVAAFAGLQKQFFDDDAQLQDARRGIFLRGDPDLVALQPNPAFPEFADHYDTGGIYRFTGGRLDFNLGSALAWNDFKLKLGATFGGIDPTGFVDSPKAAEFAEIVVFANEARYGLLFGPSTSEKLANDFSAHIHEAEKLGGAFYTTFARLHQCFKHAQKTGAVNIFPTG